MAGLLLLQSGNYSKSLALFKKLEGLYSLESDYSDIFSLDNRASRTEVIFRIDLMSIAVKVVVIRYITDRWVLCIMISFG